MEVSISEFFLEQLEKCPIEFQKNFRKIYQQLKIVDKPIEVKGVEKYLTNKKYYKLTVDKSKIILRLQKENLQVSFFLFNQHFKKNI
jgi:mRNA-degrading endonuclease RelE of RelBE toxin-antitoxin system